MATPGSGTARQSALNSEDELCGSESRSRHRSRRVPGEINDDSIVWDLNDDGRPKTRRVNPQRLALRLGPELVAEMEAYIVPGAKMPPFSIRKDFQERYSVDRRHIYDYFHSRGLRVAKEDKHTNLIRGRAMKAKVLAQPSSGFQTPTTDSSEEPTVNKACSLLAPKSTDKATVLDQTARRTTKIRERKSGVMRRSAASLKPVKKSRGPVSAMLNSSSGEVLCESGGELSVSGTDTDWDGVSISPQLTLASDSSDESITASATSDFLPSPSDFLTGFLGPPDDLPQIFSEIGSFPVNEKLISVDQERLLSKGERTELYDLISGSISSFVCVGAGQPSDLYSDVLLSVDNTTRGGRLYHHANAGKPHLVGNTYPSSFEPTHSDSHAWLSDDLDLHQSALDIPFFSALRDSLDGYSGFYDTSLSSVVDTNDYPQGAILSSQNRFPPSKGSISVSCVNQHIADHAKHNAENVHPGTYFNTR